MMHKAAQALSAPPGRLTHCEPSHIDTVRPDSSRPEFDEKAHLLNLGFCGAPKSSGNADRAIASRSTVRRARLARRRERAPEEESPE
jgi:hypothetical protein